VIHGEDPTSLALRYLIKDQILDEKHSARLCEDRAAVDAGADSLNWRPVGSVSRPLNRWGEEHQVPPLEACAEKPWIWNRIREGSDINRRSESVHARGFG
jgi:hypothetical protein